MIATALPWWSRKQRSLDRVGLAEIVVQMNRVEEGSPRVAGVLAGKCQDMVEPVTAACGNDQDAKTSRRGLILPLLIEPNLPLPTVDVLVGTDPLRAVVEFDVESETLPVLEMRGRKRNRETDSPGRPGAAGCFRGRSSSSQCPADARRRPCER